MQVGQAVLLCVGMASGCRLWLRLCYEQEASCDPFMSGANSPGLGLRLSSCGCCIVRQAGCLCSPFEDCLLQSERVAAKLNQTVYAMIAECIDKSVLVRCRCQLPHVLHAMRQTVCSCYSVNEHGSDWITPNAMCQSSKAHLLNGGKIERVHEDCHVVYNHHVLHVV